MTTSNKFKYIRRRSLCGAAFTLIELLVVVTIIVILAGLAIPGINKALAMARGAKNINNLRAIGIAMQQYAADHDQVLPVGYAGGEDSNGVALFWPHQIASYMGAASTSSTGIASVQPFFASPIARQSFNPVPTFLDTTYSMNQALAEGNQAGFGISLLTVKNSAQIVLVCDAAQNTGGVGNAPATLFAIYYASQGGSPDAPIMVSDDSSSEQPGDVSYRDNNTYADAVFVDGHVERVKRGTFLNRNFDPQ